jgi:prolipoprotein diacylglyceryl transferase
MLPILNIGPLAIQLPGLLLILGLWVGLSLSEKSAQVHNTNPNDLYNLVFSMLIGAVITARLVFVANYPSAFTHSPLSVFSLSPQLLDPWGGVAGAILVGAIVISRRKMLFPSTLDALVPAFATLMVFISIANFTSGDSFGSPTSVPWGINLWGAVRHPTQIYEAIAASLILILLRFKHKSLAAPPGLYFSVFITASAASRLIMEHFRGDSILLTGGYRAAQVIAWLFLAAGLWAIHKLIQKAPEMDKD